MIERSSHALRDRAKPEGPLGRKNGVELAPVDDDAFDLVDGLQARGQVERRPHPTDRRITLVDLLDRVAPWPQVAARRSP